MFDAETIRAQFPIFSRTVRGGKRLVYLDNAATTQRPQGVIDELVKAYTTHNANIHRGVHTLSEEATVLFEESRKATQQFVGARIPTEIIFTKSTTESINLVAQAWARPRLKAGDEILLTEMEHHANLIPWQRVAAQTGVVLRFIPVLPEGTFDLRNLSRLLTEKTKLVALVHASNFLGTLNDLTEITKRARGFEVPILLDAAQSAAHLPLHVQKLKVDFLTCSAHKLYGPFGVGILYMKDIHHEACEPFLTGGHMIKEVQFDSATYAEVPDLFEAGTQAIAEVIALQSAFTFIQDIGWESLAEHEKDVTQYLLQQLTDAGAVVHGRQTTEHRVGVVSFSVPSIHAHDLATVVDQSEGVAIRSGHHCVQPLHRKMGLTDSARASIGVYNTRDDVDALMRGIATARKILQVAQ